MFIFLSLTAPSILFSLLLLASRYSFALCMFLNRKRNRWYVLPPVPFFFVYSFSYAVFYFARFGFIEFFLVPIHPPNVLCIGLNYKAHAAEADWGEVVDTHTHTHTLIHTCTQWHIPKIAKKEEEEIVRGRRKIHKTLIKNIERKKKFNNHLWYVFVCNIFFIAKTKKGDKTLPDEPILFAKNTACVCGPNDDIVIPKVCEDTVRGVGKKKKNLSFVNCWKVLCFYSTCTCML